MRTFSLVEIILQHYFSVNIFLYNRVFYYFLMYFFVESEQRPNLSHIKSPSRNRFMILFSKNKANVFTYLIKGASIRHFLTALFPHLYQKNNLCCSIIQEILFLLIDSVIEAGECLICLSRQLTCIGKKRTLPHLLATFSLFFLFFLFSVRFINPA